ncbi:MAG: PAS domain-containing protein [bacterium]
MTQKDNEVIFDPMMHAVPVAVLLVSLEGKIIGINLEAEGVFDCLRNEVLGLDIQELFLPGTAQTEVAQNFKKVLGGEPIRGIEIPIKSSGDMECVYSWNVIRVTDDSGQLGGVLFSGLDITEYCQAADRFRLAAQVASDLIYEWDIRNDTLLWFGDIDGALGFGQGEFPRTIEAWVGRIHPNDIARLADAVELHRTSTKPISYEYQIQHRDGPWRHWLTTAYRSLTQTGAPVNGLALVPT